MCALDYRLDVSGIGRNDPRKGLGVVKGLTQDPAACESIVAVTAGHTHAVVSCFGKRRCLCPDKKAL